MLVFPIVLLIILGLAQGVLWFHARSAAQAAAHQGARVAAAERGSAGEGISSARRFVADSAGAIRGFSVSGSRSGETASITVVGTSPSILGPGITVRQSASMPVERVTG